MLRLVLDMVYGTSKHYANAGQRMPGLFVKLYAYQMCRAPAYMHSPGVCHRHAPMAGAALCRAKVCSRHSAAGVRVLCSTVLLPSKSAGQNWARMSSGEGVNSAAQGTVLQGQHCCTGWGRGGGGTLCRCHSMVCFDGWLPTVLQIPLLKAALRPCDFGSHGD